MNTICKLILLLFLTASFFSQAQNIAGSYFLIASKCSIHLKIDKNRHFIFTLKKGKKVQGMIKISKEKKEDEFVYLDFGEGIGGIFSNDTIDIQNAGNAMNPYHHFRECDEMYIHWAKKKTK